MFFELGCVTLMLLFFYICQHKNQRAYPPGPIGLPFVGNLHQIGLYPFKTFLKMKAKYGKIIAIEIPGYSAIVLNDPKIIREALNMTEFSGRIQCAAVKSRFGGIGNKGIAFNEGKGLFEQRRFVLKTLRDFGFGKKSLESLIHNEVKELVTTLLQLHGKPFEPEDAFNLSVVNSLWTIITGRRFKNDDKKFRYIVKLLTDMTKKMPFSGAFLFFPQIYCLAPKFTGYNNFINTNNEMLALIREEYEEHLIEFKEDGLRDYLDAHIQETLSCYDKHSSFFGTEGEHNLLVGVLDLFGAALETTSKALIWSFLYLSINPSVQSKIFEEIKTVIGLSKLPSLMDRPNMPYSEATLIEVLRLSSIAPLSITHRAMETVQFHGFTIPKDTLIIPNLYGVHHDQDIWGDPENFRPERFITEDEKINKKHEAFLAFSVGKRVCLGQSLVKDQLFLFLTSLVQKFHILTNPLKPKPDPTQFTFSLLVLAPKSYDYILTERS